MDVDKRFLMEIAMPRLNPRGVFQGGRGRPASSPSRLQLWGRPPVAESDSGLVRRVRGMRRSVIDRLLCRLCAMALAMAVFVPSPALAEYATGGSGTYRQNILWFDWGSAPNSIPQAGSTITNTITVAGRSLVVACSLSNISGVGADPDLSIYRPGTWSEDGLDDLYNIGGTGAANTMDIGLRGRTGSPANFTFACSATLGGAPFTLGGLVFADAEATGSSESIQVTLPAGGTFRVLERLRQAGCTRPYNVSVNGSVVRFTAPNNNCSNGLGGQTGPMAVGFIQDATSANVVVGASGGVEAVAMGVMLYVADYGDAPASYGDAAHVMQPAWNGGAVPSGSNPDIFTNFTLATLAQPAVRLGASMDIENANQASSNASGDDNTGSDDEDAFGTLANIGLSAGGTYSLTVPCAGNGATVRGFIDFNRDGDFADAGETSAATTCNGSNAVPTWTLPAAAGLSPGASFVRLRIATNPTEVQTPIGMATDGEVEDYPVTLTGPTLQVAKQSIGATGSFTFSGGNGYAGDTVTTAASGVYVAGLVRTLSAGNVATTVTESDPGSGWAVTADAVFQCVDDSVDSNRPVAGLSFDAATRSYTIPAASVLAGSRFRCRFVNTRTTTLQLAKAWAPNSIAGNVVTIGATTGGVNNTLAFDATAPTAANSGAAVTVNVGNVVTLPAETGANVGNYTTTLACTGGHTLSGGNGQQANTLTIASGNAAVCTYTNTVRTSTLQLAKAWAPNSIAGNAVTIGATTGGANNTASFNATAPTAANSGTAVTVNVGNVITLPAEGGTNAANYTTTLACTGGHTLSGGNGQQANTLTITSTTAAVCTYTNTLNQADLSVTKTNNATTVIRGSQTTYTVTVRNNGPSAANGSLVRDTPVSNLSSCSVTSCTPAASCPGTPGNLLAAGGATLGTLAANGSAVFTVQCTVNN